MTREELAAICMGPIVGSDRAIAVASFEACRETDHHGCQHVEPSEAVADFGPDCCMRCAADLAFEIAGAVVEAVP